jgi:hypothetical protein
VLVAVAIGAVAQGVHGRFEHRPAQVFRAGFGQRPRRSLVPDWITRGHSPV